MKFMKPVVICTLLSVSTIGVVFAKDKPAESMSMQGGEPPSDARDPNAYSGGFTLNSGPYSLPKSQSMRVMDDHGYFGSVLINRFERQLIHPGQDASNYDLQAWYGKDYDRAVLKAEGLYANSHLQDARTELLWSHAFSTYWDFQGGLRQDSGVKPDRTWLAFGVQGLAPYWFNTEATFYLGQHGRTAIRLSNENEFFLTQKLILQPRAEINAYGKPDNPRERGSGLSDAVIGMRLRYEITRQFAPYIGIERSLKFAGTAEMARSAGEPIGETRFVAGLRLWF